MRIDELNQKATLSPRGDGRSERSEPSDTHGETVAKQQTAADKVDLSSNKPASRVSDLRQDERVSRIAEIKSQVQARSYQVPGRAVAEMMLSKIVMGGSF